MEKSDPCNITLLLSNDVLEEEKLLVNPKTTADELFHLNLRLQLINQ